MNLINKHLGSILRDAMKKNGIEIDRTWGEWLSDLVRSSSQKEKAKKELLSKDINVDAFIAKAKTEEMRRHTPPPSGTSPTASGSMSKGGYIRF